MRRLMRIDLARSQSSLRAHHRGLFTVSEDLLLIRNRHVLPFRGQQHASDQEARADQYILFDIVTLILTRREEPGELGAERRPREP
jgi:hypothetical protein